mgnify:CR=1 FL=1
MKQLDLFLMKYSVCLQKHVPEELDLLFPNLEYKVHRRLRSDEILLDLYHSFPSQEELVVSQLNKEVFQHYHVQIYREYYKLFHE